MLNTEIYDVIAPAIGPLPQPPHDFYETISGAGSFATYQSETRARYCLSWWLRSQEVPYGEIAKTPHGWTTRGSTKPFEKASGIVVLIRLANGGDMHTCPTCGCARSAPQRRRQGGRIVEGCVDASHTGLVMGDDLAWHERPVAVALREQEAQRLQGVA